MKHLCACLLILAWTAASRADASPLQQARQRWLKGNYGEALDDYRALAKEPRYHVAAVLGQSRVLQSQGQTDDALAVIDTALGANGTSADLHARRAELLYFR